MKNSKGFVAIAQNFNIKSKKVKRLREGVDFGPVSGSELKENVL
jgi:hypothetical protein